MAISDTTSAALQDLDADLGSYGGTATDHLKKIACLASVAARLWPTVDRVERPAVVEKLHDLADKHQLPGDCLAPMRSEIAS